jgi:hypothetical protein
MTNKCLPPDNARLPVPLNAPYSTQNHGFHPCNLLLPEQTAQRLCCEATMTTQQAMGQQQSGTLRFTASKHQITSQRLQAHLQRGVIGFALQNPAQQTLRTTLGNHSAWFTKIARPSCGVSSVATDMQPKVTCGSHVRAQEAQLRTGPPRQKPCGLGKLRRFSGTGLPTT